MIWERAMKGYKPEVLKKERPPMRYKDIADLSFSTLIRYYKQRNFIYPWHNWVF